MVEASILPAIRARLASMLRPPDENYHPFCVEGDIVGWLNDDRSGLTAMFRDVFDVHDDAIFFASALATSEARTEAVADVAERLAAAGHLSAWRNERYAVGASFGAPPHFLLERAAARFFGVRTYAAHVNGFVAASARTDPDGQDAMWIARRSPSKPIDPGMLDNLVGGGVAAGMSVAATVVKEAWEEAGIPARLAQQALPAGTVDICRTQPDGLHRETIFVHDLRLPAEFVPENRDGEVVAFHPVPLVETAELIARADGPDVVTADASLVILDCLLRLGMIADDAPDFRALDALRHPAMMTGQR